MSASKSTRKMSYKRRQETQEQKIRRIARTQAINLSNKIAIVTNSVSTGELINHNGTVFSLLSTLSRGDNSLNNFRGDTITPLSLKMRYTLLANDQPQNMRVIIFQWFQSSTPTPAGLLDTPNSFLGTALAPFSDKQFDNRKTYKILYDKFHNLTNTGAGDNNISHGVEVYIPSVAFQPIEFVYNSGAPQKGGLYVCAVSDSSAPTHPSFFYVCSIIASDN